MNIACTACPARYGVADEKILGKRVRITCKRCATVLVIDGTVSPPLVSASTSIAPGPAGRPASSAPPMASLPPPPAPPPEPFLVLFSDEQQERADVAQIVRLHRAGRIGAETLVWREGMENWQSPWDVEEIASAFRRMGYTRPTPVPSGDAPPAEAGEDEAAPSAASSPDASFFDDDEATNVVDTSGLGLRRRARVSEPASSPVREDDEQPTHVARGSSARATGRTSSSQRTTRNDRQQRTSTRPGAGAARVEPARRRESRRPSTSPLAERFARQADAGSEADEELEQRVEPAEAHGLMDATDEGQRLTGARNENSVLFSLDTLLKKEQRSVEPPRRQPAAEESLLVDDGASLPAGGGFAPALAAPDFTAPITAPPPQFSSPATVEPVVYPRGDSSKKWMIATGAVVVLSALGFAWMSGALNPVLSAVGLGPSPSAEPTPEPSAAPAATAEPAPTPAESASAEPEPPASASASAAPSAPAAAQPAPQPVAAAPRAPSGERPSAAAARPAPPPTGGDEPSAEPDSPAAAPAAAATTPAPAAGGEAFDTGAAKTALTSAANNAASCKEPGGATGDGRVSITFAPSGRPTSVAVTGDLAGTTVGSCVARLFRQTRVPPFSGDPVTVAKSFSVK